MPEYDLALRGGTIAIVSGGHRADIGIQDGRVISIGERIGGAARVIEDGRMLSTPADSLCLKRGYSPHAMRS